jgi:hypothetical protein
MGSLKDGRDELFAQGTEGGKNWTMVFIAHLTRDTSTPGSADYVAPNSPQTAR